MDIDARLEREAKTLTHYLIREMPREQEIRLYANAVHQTTLNFDNNKEERIWNLMMKYPGLIGMFDAGLALLDSGSLIRKRIFLMLAVLEASPAYTNKFLASGFRKIYLLDLGLRMGFSVMKSVTGYLALKTYGMLWR